MENIKYSGDLNDLVLFGAELIEDLYYITFQDKIYSLEDKKVFTSFNNAKQKLTKHLYRNFCQGHYWHENKNNTFSQNLGWMRNSGNVNKSDKEFKELAKQLTETLLNDKVFKIQKFST